MRLSDYIANNYDYYNILDIVWQTLALFPQTEILYPDALEVEEDGNILRLCPQPPVPDRYTRIFKNENRKHAALANLLMQILTGEDILSISDYEDEDIISILTDEDTLFTAEEVERIAWGQANRDIMRQAVLDLGARDPALREKGLNDLRNLFNHEPCCYTLTLQSMDGTASGTETVQLTCGDQMKVWPSGDEPCAVLSDRCKYSFRSQRLRYRPGNVSLTLTASAKMPEAPPPVDPPVDPPDELEHIIVGIDLGTEKTCVACTNGELIPLESDSSSIPSALFYLNSIDCEIGKAARNRGGIHPQACVSAFKRHIGSSNVVPGIIAKDGTPIRHTGMDSSARFLSTIRTRMRENGYEIDKLVISVPADFNNVKRSETFRAAANAGFSPEDVRLLEEPTAAAFHYGCHNQNGLTAVFDLGGGTFDICILKGTPDGSNVLAKGGDTNLGGVNFTSEVQKIFLRKAADDGVILPPITERSNDRNVAGFNYQLRSAAEQAKIRLTLEQSVRMTVNHQTENRILAYDISRQEFESAMQPYLARIHSEVLTILGRANCTADQIDRVIIIGGSTMIPCVDELIRQKLFPNCRRFLDEDRITPVAYGAALFARSIWSPPEESVPPILPVNKTAYDLGVRTSFNEFCCIIPAGTEYSQEGYSGHYDLGFAEDTGTHLTIHLFTREAGSREGSISIWAVNNPIKPIGKLHFEALPSDKMRRRTLRVILNLDRDGVLTAEAQILSCGRVEASCTANIESYERR